MIDIEALKSSHSACGANISELDGPQNTTEVRHSECTFALRNSVLVLDCDKCGIFVNSGSPRPDVAALIDLTQLDHQRFSWMVIEVKQRAHTRDALRRARRQVQAGIVALLDADLVSDGMLLQGFILSRTTPSSAELQVLSMRMQRGFTIRGQKIVPRVLVCGASLN